MIHELPLEQRTLHGRFSREFEAVLAVDPGDSVRVDVPNAGWYLDSRDQFVSRDPAVHDGHALAGPIQVRGARAGQTLVVRVDDVTPGSWGITEGEPGQLLRWELAGGVARSGSFTVPLRPFFGSWACRRPSRGRIRRGRLGGGAATSTAGSSLRGRRSSCRCLWTAPSSRSATRTARRATARCRGRRSSAPHGGR